MLALLSPVARGATDIVVCQACHGAHGEGNPMLNAPALAGQHQNYLERQVMNFRAGRRGADASDTTGAVMRAQAMALDPADIARLTAAFAALPAAKTTAGAGDAARGKARFDSECAACHGWRGDGYPQLGTPNLRILGAAYFAAQVGAYQRGWRGASVAEGPLDQHGEWMRAVAGVMTEPRDVADIQTYLASLR
jgi:cytochrome c oxidase subunit 2